MCLSRQLQIMEADEGFERPKLVIYGEKDFSSLVSYSLSDAKNNSKESGTFRDAVPGLRQSERFKCSAGLASNVHISCDRFQLQGNFIKNWLCDQNVWLPERKPRDEKVKEMNG